MAKPHSPLLGFNNNVRHKGRIFHIQTEDSGIKFPHVITHLFADGGRILKSLKTSYAEHVGSDNLEETVRAMMKDQHKAMFIALRDGEFDSYIDEPQTAPAPRTGPSAASPTPPERKDPKEPPKAQPPRTNSAAMPAARVPVSPSALAARVAAPSRPAPPMGSKPKPSTPSPRQGASIEALERAAADAQHQSPLFQEPSAMPPPPAAVLSPRKPVGAYRAVNTPAAGTGHGSPAPGASPAGPTSASRYSASRPASIFASAKPSQTGSVFGDDVIGDRSLDEVILSFLSEEFGAGSDDDPKK